MCSQQTTTDLPRSNPLRVTHCSLSPLHFELDDRNVPKSSDATLQISSFEMPVPALILTGTSRCFIFRHFLWRSNSQDRLRRPEDVSSCNRPSWGFRNAKRWCPRRSVRRLPVEQACNSRLPRQNYWYLSATVHLDISFFCWFIFFSQKRFSRFLEKALYTHNSGSCISGSASRGCRVSQVTESFFPASHRKQIRIFGVRSWQMRKRTKIKLS